ncbi:hypothetical protein [Streptomyces sp. NPDC096323]|uniref:hypothetical protein n=1 Tax=Streptomyces sp. NPDC096323 TaxID=3155822 RepID=UPI00333417C9
MDTNDDQTTDDQTGRSYTSAEISRTIKKDQQATAMGRFHEALHTVAAEYEHAQAAARNAVTSSALAALAENFTRATTDAHRRDLAAEVAQELTLAEAGTIRRAAEAVRLGTPGIILRAAANDMTPNEIARELGATGSYVRRILRENRVFSWRLDLFNSQAGPGWQSWESGTDVMPYSEDHNVMDELAAQILTQAGRGARKYVARVTVWQGSEDQADDASIYSTEFHPRTTD